jgi:hypothetical protein
VSVQSERMKRYRPRTVGCEKCDSLEFAWQRPTLRLSNVIRLRAGPCHLSRVVSVKRSVAIDAQDGVESGPNLPTDAIPVAVLRVDGDLRFGRRKYTFGL